MVTLPAPPAPAQATEVPDFWQWLNAQCVAVFGSFYAANRALGLGDLSRMVRTRSWPYPDRLAAIAARLEAPAEWLASWQVQARESWAASGRNGASILQRAGLSSAATVPCAEPGCDQVLLLSRFTRGCRLCPAHGRARGKGRRRIHTPSNPLAAFIGAELQRQGVKWATFSVAYGSTPNWFAGMARRKRWRPHLAILLRLATTLKVDAAVLLPYSSRTSLDPRPTRLKNGIDPVTGKRAQWVRNKIQAGHLARWEGLTDDDRRLYAARLQTPGARARCWLSRRLGRTQRPSKNQVETWANEAAVKLGLSPLGVLAEWRPLLILRGLRHSGGRPTIGHRCSISLKLEREFTPTPRGRYSSEFWDEFVLRVEFVEGEGIVDRVMLQGWRTMHVRRCPAGHAATNGR